LDSIFVSYRRSDSQGEAGRLFDDLAKNFGEDKVFMDVAAIEAGRDFRKAIEEGVTKCGVLLVLIGLDWLEAKDEHGVQRLADPSDFVRIETASALKRDIPVIPVLVRGARMPAAEQLPDELKELAYRNCIELTHARWKSDVQLLVAALMRLMGERKAESGAGAVRDGKAADAEAGAGGGARMAFRADDLERLTRELAIYIGPIAGVIVKRAAAQSASRDELCVRVAEEIEEQEDCERFLRKVGATGVVPRWNRAAATEGAAGSDAAAAAGKSVRPLRKSAASEGVEAPVMAPQAAGEEERGFFGKYGLVVLAVIVVLSVAVGVVMRSAASREKSGSSGAAAGSVENSGARNVAVPAAGETASESHATAPKNGESASAADAESVRPKKEPPALPKPNSGTVRVSEETSKTMLVTKVMPVYPVLARQGRIQGMVVLDADVSKDGVVTNLKVVSGHPLLAASAVDAVKQYRYRAYEQDGKAMAWSTQISVNFVLSQQ
jgi:TonB family protein